MEYSSLGGRLAWHAGGLNQCTALHKQGVVVCACDPITQEVEKDWEVKVILVDKVSLRIVWNS